MCPLICSSEIPVSSFTPSRSMVTADCVRLCEPSLGGDGYASASKELCEPARSDDRVGDVKHERPSALLNNDRFVISGEDSKEERRGDKALDIGE